MAGIGRDRVDVHAVATVTSRLIWRRVRGKPTDVSADVCRLTASFEAYENALERAGIPFLTVAGRGFDGRPEVRDVLNALSALADPSDDVAMAGLLRSPAIALTDASLYRLRLAGAQPMPAASLWDALRVCGETLPEPEAARARRAASLVEHLHGLVGRVPVAELLKAYLDATDYRAALLAAGQPRAARNVAKLLADAHQAGIVSVGEFLEYVAALRDSEAREGEARAVAEGVAQIMSVHAAKGLEWPVVVIGDANYQRSGSRQPPLLHPRWGLLLGLKDKAGETSMMYRLAQREEAERDRGRGRPVALCRQHASLASG